MGKHDEKKGFIYRVCNLYLLFIIECLAIIFKSYLLFKVSMVMSREKFQKMPFFLLLTLIGTMADDISWITKIIQLLFLPI